MAAKSDTRGSLTLKGLVEEDVAALFIEQLAQLTPQDAPIRLELAQAKLANEEVAASIADHIRQTAKRIGAVEVVGAPTALARALDRSKDPRLQILLDRG
jgi:hypothetical protein